MIFNRSHYEDVLVVRVHKWVPKSVWSKRYDLINDFEKTLHDNGTRILKFYLHISPEEQLERFAQRLDDPMRHWKISEGDYSERKSWPEYMKAYEEAMERTSTKHAPWYVIPSDHKWFRNLAISEILAHTLEEDQPEASHRRRWTSRKFAASITPRRRGRRGEATSRRRLCARSKYVCLYPVTTKPAKLREREPCLHVEGCKSTNVSRASAGDVLIVNWQGGLHDQDRDYLHQRVEDRGTE